MLSLVAGVVSKLVGGAVVRQCAVCCDADWCAGCLFDRDQVSLKYAMQSLTHLHLVVDIMTGGTTAWISMCGVPSVTLVAVQRS